MKSILKKQSSKKNKLLDIQDMKYLTEELEIQDVKFLVEGWKVKLRKAFTKQDKGVVSCKRK